MSILDYTPKADLWTGLAIGAGLLAAPAVLAMVTSVARPVAKELVKTGLRVYEKGNEMVSGFAEGVQDLAAEAKSEVHTASAAPKAARKPA